MPSDYPDSLIAPLRAQVEAIDAYYRPRLPDDKVLTQLLDTAYHASFLTEEKRGLSFRILFAEKEDVCNEYHRMLYQSVILEDSRIFGTQEILRLAPALDISHTLMCISEVKTDSGESSLVIWGILDIGNYWAKFSRNAASFGITPPQNILISCTSPGSVTISSRGQVLVSLRNGRVRVPNTGALYDGTFEIEFREACEDFEDSIVAQLGPDKYNPEVDDNHWPRRFYPMFIGRLLSNVKDKAHGGTVLFLPDYVTTAHVESLGVLEVKYNITHDLIWRLLIDMLVSHKRDVLMKNELEKGLDLTPERYSRSRSMNFRKVMQEDKISDALSFVAGLSAVDGAVLMTDRFRILGFGAEIRVPSQDLKYVKDNGRLRSIADFGTRHRSAFRFCHAYPKALAFIVSSDGGLKAAQKRGEEVHLWHDIDESAISL